MTDEGPIDRPPPGVSIILATFNRPDVLAFAIRSVLAQDFQDWEMIVVGDLCTQSTATTIAGFDDPRITYLNLPLRYGDQSGPNNVGIARARGRYLAFLNHDDLWFPDHLSTTIAWLEASGADMVIARAADISRSAKPDETLGTSQWYVELIGHGRAGRYDPASTVAASACWSKPRPPARFRPGRRCPLATGTARSFGPTKSGGAVSAFATCRT
jgi:glycosyltransferase involved in cell wall biosynthesis